VKFASAMDELEHWMQRLTLDLKLGVERRHILATARLCEVFADKVSRDKRAPQAQLERRMALSMAWLDLQRRVNATAPAQPNPSARRVGNLRVITGGRSGTGTTRR